MVTQFWIEVRSRPAALFARRSLHAGASEELQFYLAMREQCLIESGVPPGEAYARAGRELAAGTPRRGDRADGRAAGGVGEGTLVRGHFTSAGWMMGGQVRCSSVSKMSRNTGGIRKERQVFVNAWRLSAV